MKGVILALCVEMLHRHPYELGHLPSSVLVDLLGFQMLKSEALRSDA